MTGGLTAPAAGAPVGRPAAAADSVAPEQVVRWLERHVAGLAGISRIDLIAAGRSNLTYRVEDADGRQVVVRRPPPPGAGASTHDIGREHRVLAALSANGLAVPRPLALCTDPAVWGTPFLVMAYVEGSILRTRADAELLEPAARGRAGRSLVTTLLAVHELDVAAAGLSDLSAHEGYVERQLRRWRGQLDVVDFDGRAELLAAYEVLAGRVPAQQHVSLVHGDYRLDNVVLDPDGNVVSVLDWELATLGDPLADLGVLLASWAVAGDPVLTVEALEPTRATGFPTAASLVEAYTVGSSLDLSGIGYHLAFGRWKLACVLHGVQVRYAAGRGAGDLAGADQLGRVVGRLAADAHARTRQIATG